MVSRVKVAGKRRRVVVGIAVIAALLADKPCAAVLDIFSHKTGRRADWTQWRRRNRKEGSASCDACS